MHRFVFNYLSKYFFRWRHINPRHRCQWSIIRFVPKYLDQILVNFSTSPAGDWQTGRLWWEVVESRFHVDLKSNFALKNNSMEFLLGPITRRITCTMRITDEMDMTPLQVSCWRGKFLRRTQGWYSFNYYLYTIEQWALRTWVWCSYGLRVRIRSIEKTWSWKFYPAAQNFTNRMLFRNTYIFKTI